MFRLCLSRRLLYGVHRSFSYFASCKLKHLIQLRLRIARFRLLALVGPAVRAGRCTCRAREALRFVRKLTVICGCHSVVKVSFSSFSMRSFPPLFGTSSSHSPCEYKRDLILLAQSEAPQKQKEHQLKNLHCANSVQNVI